MDPFFQLGSFSSVSAFYFFLTTIFNGMHNVDETTDYLRSKIVSSQVDQMQYDVIIVGGGSAGSLLAGRLSEDPGISVLLLEAGGEPNPLLSVPDLAVSAPTSKYDWTSTSVPQMNGSFGYIDNHSRDMRGKMLGGSSSMNYMIYYRGNRFDYDNWKSMGNKGWSYNEVLPFFKRLEDRRSKNDTPRGNAGPVTIEDSLCDTGICELFRKVGQEMNNWNEDQNGEKQNGIGLMQTSTRNGRRWNSLQAFLNPARDRPNLRIEKYALVEKVIFSAPTPSGCKPRATGVVFWKNGKRIVVNSTQETILSSGTIGSPHILMLSGIGPKNDLDKLKIPVIANLPVGENFHNHFGVLVNFVVPKSSLAPGVQMATLQNSLSKLGNGEIGPLSAIPLGNAPSAFIVTKYQTNKLWPDVQTYFSLADPGVMDLVRHLFGSKPVNTEGQPFVDVSRLSAITATVTITRPFSRGKISLASTNINDLPILDSKILSDPRDLEMLVEGIKESVKIMETNATKSLGAQFVPYPICRELEFKSDDFWRCIVRIMVKVMYHYAGSNSMGKVVDSKLRVIGVDRLRVIDASVIPLITTGNINGPTMMIAEKGADMIKRSLTPSQTPKVVRDQLEPPFKGNEDRIRELAKMLAEVVGNAGRNKIEDILNRIVKSS